MNFNRNLGSTELEFISVFDEKDEILSDKDDDIFSNKNDCFLVCNSKSCRKLKNRTKDGRVKYDKEKVRIQNQKTSRLKNRGKERSTKYWKKNGEDFDHEEVEEHVWLENERLLEEEYRRELEECKRIFFENGKLKKGVNPNDVQWYLDML